MKNLMYEKIEKTKEYLDYIEEHYNNVQKAWKLVQEKCKDEKFIYDDFEFSILDNEIRNHDLSKLDKEEFTQYRDRFYKYDNNKKNDIINKNFDNAWNNHKEKNDHHYETWTKKRYSYPRMQLLHCVHMIIDWIAMGFKFNDTALEYYKRNQDNIHVPEWAEILIIEICEKFYK
ncbi:MAG: hypothetical protein JXB50_08025 [Spirochaetes bacterium]|nr:hypothetical protein [Spirochaetota bacterium]